MSVAPKNKNNASALSCRELIQRRATMYAKIRQFFAERDVLEVETPIFSQSGNTDPSIASVMADFSNAFPHELNKNAQLRYAHTSPEFAMKRLLANDSGAIYQICKVFRKEECGRLHNPEFSMLEWYRPAMKYHALMDEISVLLSVLAISESTERLSYAELFQRELQLDVLNASVDELKNCAVKNGINAVGFDDDYDVWTAILLANLIESKLGVQKPTFIYDYPASQAALAKRRDKDKVAERFELYINGMEIANGYQELTDEKIYLERFLQDNEKRKLSCLPEITIDNRLINDLSSGFPDSSGVAVGLDRLLMSMTGVSQIEDVLSFHFNNC